MSDVYDIWLYPLQDWWRTVNEMSDFMSTGQMGNFIFRPVIVSSIHIRDPEKFRTYTRSPTWNALAQEWLL